MVKNSFERVRSFANLTIPGNMPEVVFYFGSQTGTAEKFANQLEEDAERLGVEQSKVIDFNNFTPEEFCAHKFVVFVVATHYEGDPCDNTKNFHKWFKGLQRDKSNPTPFKGMKFTVFGLGDTSYEQFNEIGV